MSAITIDPASDINHPTRELSLSQAIKIANGIANLRCEAAPYDLQEARALFADQLKRTDHVWITGLAALDLLDAAIAGRDIGEMDLRV